MTTCELIMKPIVRMVEEEGKDLDEIACSVCPKIEYGREKIIIIIKDFLGNDYLIKHASTLKYDIKMAEMAKKRKPKTHEEIDAIDKSHKKIPAIADSDPDKSSCEVSKSPKEEPISCCSPEPKNTIHKLVNEYGFDTVQNAIDEIGYEET